MGRLDQLERRRLDDSILVKASMVNEVYRRIKESESVRYTIGAMQPIDPEYTRNTFAQGDRVKSQLQERLADEHDFEYQGSTTTDTHIKARSDVDLLVIQKAWVRLEHPQKPKNPYQGEPAVDMRKLRTDASAALKQAFPAATVDASLSRAVRLSGASLTREVDVVPASWYETNEYVRTNDRALRGVEVFDNNNGAFTMNTPFLLKRRIEDRDRLTRGGLRKAARLMKSLMYDSEGRVDMSSYNIVGIAYNIPEQDLVSPAPRELMILEACFAFCDRLGFDTALRTTITVPDGHRTVFGDKPGASTGQLAALATELANLRRDVMNDNVRAFKRLAEARVEYAVAAPSF